jgi:hypothetical protein
MKESIDGLKKMLKTATDLAKQQERLADDKINEFKDEKEKEKYKSLLSRAKKGELTVEQLIKEINGN